MHRGEGDGENTNQDPVSDIGAYGEGGRGNTHILEYQGWSGDDSNQDSARVVGTIPIRIQQVTFPEA